MVDDAKKNHDEREWTDVEVETLRAQWAQDKSAGWIAVHLNRSRNSVISKVHQLRRKGEAFSSRKSGRATLSRNERLEVSNRRRAKAGKPLLDALPPAAKVVPLESGNVQPLHRTIAEIEARECRWPYGDGPFTFCGHVTALGVSYCPTHAKLAFATPTPVAKRAANPPQYVLVGGIASSPSQGSGEQEKPATPQNTKTRETV